MADLPSTVVVVPCYDEEARFAAEPFLAAARSDPSLRFVLVDDGSRDRTREVLSALPRASAQFVVLGLDRNGGKAEAVRQGTLRAFESAPALVAYLDADLATPLTELAPMRRMLAADPELSIVLGSRVALLGRDVRRSRHRHYMGRVFATAASLVLGETVYDTQCGAKVLRNTPVTRSTFALPFRARWTFDVELLARLKALAGEGALPELRRSAAEYPLECWHDKSGSKVGPRAVLGAAAELSSVWLRYRRGWAR
jgi:dolichyl-phosphate beta-glucosyltransferase